MWLEGRERIVGRSWRLAVLSIVAGAVAAHAGLERLPTPAIGRIEVRQEGGQVGYMMRGEIGDTGFYVGLALVCRTDGARQAEATVFFAGFPESRQPVQLAVRDAGGRVERFGPVVRGGPESGFHSPRLTAAAELERFVTAALKTGSLVSNGYRSFWNRVGEAENRRVAESFLGCVRGAE